MNYFKIALCTLFLSLGFSTPSFAEIVVIINPNNNNEINADIIRKIFLKKINTFSDGVEAKPFDLLDEARQIEFTKKALRKTSSSLHSYWSRMIFSAKGYPPKALSAAEMKRVVASNISAIGYIDSKDVDDSVKVLATQGL